MEILEHPNQSDWMNVSSKGKKGTYVDITHCKNFQTPCRYREGVTAAVGTMYG
jgi:hypothetical protein